MYYYIMKTCKHFNIYLYFQYILCGVMAINITEKKKAHIFCYVSVMMQGITYFCRVNQKKYIEKTQ